MKIKRSNGISVAAKCRRGSGHHKVRSRFLEEKEDISSQMACILCGEYTTETRESYGYILPMCKICQDSEDMEYDASLGG